MQLAFMTHKGDDMRLSTEEIARAKQQANLQSPRHEHDDCIRMAYEWLDAQKTTPTRRADDWKHIVEYWCGRYITDDDVKIAALLHPRVEPDGNRLNISRRLVLPSFERLIGITGAKKHTPRMEHRHKMRYSSCEW